MASICGAGFQDAAAVYAEKISPQPIDRAPSLIMLMGLATEPHNAALYTRRTGARLLDIGIVKARCEPWAFATFDRVRRDDGCGPDSDRAQRHEPFGRPVELKYAGPFFGDEWGPDGSDEVKDGYVIQATWQAQILTLNGHRITGTDLSALSGSGEHRVYPIPFDARLGALLLDVGRAFWDRVRSRAGVDGWNPPLLDAVAERMVAIRPDTAVELDADAVALVEEIDALTVVKRTGEEAEERIKVLKKQLAALLGGYQFGELPDGRRVKQSLIPGKVITPAPYEREPRVNVSIIKAKKGKR